jgi:hypothetical protein
MWFGHDRCLYLEHYTGKQKEEGCRYFTIDLKGEEIFDKNNYLRLQEQGVFPLMYNNMNYSDVLDPEGFPTDLTKVYFDNWALDKYDIGRQTTGPTAAWTESYVLTDLEEAIKKIMKR